MTEPVYFVVERTPRGEAPAIYHDRLPEHLTRKIPRDDRGQPCEPAPIIYAVRLDTLNGAHKWLGEFLKKPLAEIYAEYCRRRDDGELPPQNLAGPPRKSDGTARRQLGDYWTPPKRTWPDRPPAPLGAAGYVMVDGKLVPRICGPMDSERKMPISKSLATQDASGVFPKPDVETCPARAAVGFLLG